MIPVDCAVNDDHGNTADRIAAIHFPGLELDACDMRGPVFRELRKAGQFRIRIGRRQWPARHLASCVGNIYWERYGLEDVDAAALLHELRQGGAFTLDGGFEELCNWWDSGVIDVAFVGRLLVDAAKEQWP